MNALRDVFEQLKPERDDIIISAFSPHSHSVTAIDPEEVRYNNSILIKNLNLNDKSELDCSTIDGYSLDTFSLDTLNGAQKKKW